MNILYSTSNIPLLHLSPQDSCEVSPETFPGLLTVYSTLKSEIGLIRAKAGIVQEFQQWDPRLRGISRKSMRNRT